MELRSLCIVDPVTDEVLQLSFLCHLDTALYEAINEDVLLARFGTIKKIGCAKDKSFIKLGIYPVSIAYEKHNKIVRQKENSLSDFEQIDKNIYKPSSRVMYIIKKMDNFIVAAA